MMSRADDPQNPIVCFCFGVTQQEVLDVIHVRKVSTVMDITAYCKAGNGCCSCWALLESMLPPEPPSSHPTESNA